MTRRSAPANGKRRWRLVVCGHSLGAGIAAFVGMHLRRIFVNVHVWCFSPPGWLMTPELADSAKGFLTSVVINKDIVPRCGSPMCRQSLRQRVT